MATPLPQPGTPQAERQTWIDRCIAVVDQTLKPKAEQDPGTAQCAANTPKAA
jgi:hypothetical protein